jgi:hypothetical protein
LIRYKTQRLFVFSLSIWMRFLRRNVINVALGLMLVLVIGYESGIKASLVVVGLFVLLYINGLCMQKIYGWFRRKSSISGFDIPLMIIAVMANFYGIMHGYLLPTVMVIIAPFIIILAFAIWDLNGNQKT